MGAPFVRLGLDRATRLLLTPLSHEGLAAAVHELLEGVPGAPERAATPQT